MPNKKAFLVILHCMARSFHPTKTVTRKGSRFHTNNNSHIYIKELTAARKYIRAGGQTLSLLDCTLVIVWDLKFEHSVSR
jgi:hypothetical protein